MVSILCTQGELTVGTMLQVCVSNVAELTAKTFIGGEGDFIVKQNWFLCVSLIPTSLSVPRQVQIVRLGFRQPVCSYPRSHDSFSLRGRQLTLALKSLPCLEVRVVGLVTTC